MTDFSVRGVLLDIEGTTSAIAYVYDVMFPFARKALPGFLEAHWGSEGCSAAAEQVARDAGHAGLAEWRQATGGEGQTLVRNEVERLMDADVKATGLKQLQGLIWQAGFESGDMRAHVYDDTPPALERWRGAGIDLRVYSSGSVHAQRLFFGHTDCQGTGAGDLLPFFSGHYDTTTGPKKESASYAAIAADWGLPPGEVLFLSDVLAELDAARSAGMATALVVRPGNKPIDGPHDHLVVGSFAELRLEKLS